MDREKLIIDLVEYLIPIRDLNLSPQESNYIDALSHLERILFRHKDEFENKVPFTVFKSALYKIHEIDAMEAIRLADNNSYYHKALRELVSDLLFKCYEIPYILRVWVSAILAKTIEEPKVRKGKPAFPFRVLLLKTCVGMALAKGFQVSKSDSSDHTDDAFSIVAEAFVKSGFTDVTSNSVRDAFYKK